MNQATCPSCNGELKKFPARKTKCPHCGNFIYVKRAPGESEKRLVTEAQAAEIEAQWNTRSEERAADEFCHLYHIDPHRYARVRDTLAKSTEPASLRWNTEYFLARERAATESDLQMRKMLYFHLSRLCEHKKLYRDRRDFLVKMHESELERYQGSMGAIVGVRVSGGNRACPVCQAHNGKRYTVEQALAEQPLPCTGCTCGETGNDPGLCQCYYSSILRGGPEA
jgi:uncharacterized Zn finger protein (UPF0148 family)